MVFHGREPLTPLDLRFRSGQIAQMKTTYSSNTEVKNFTSDLYRTTRENAIISYQKYRSFYDKKALAQPLKLHRHCLLLDPRLTGHDKFTKKSEAKWIALFSDSRTSKTNPTNETISKKTSKIRWLWKTYIQWPISGTTKTLKHSLQSVVWKTQTCERWTHPFTVFPKEWTKFALNKIIDDGIKRHKNYLLELRAYKHAMISEAIS